VAPMPGSFVAAGRTLGACVLAAAIALAFAIVRGKPIDRDVVEESRIPSILREIAAGIREIGLARTTLAAFALSCLLLAGQILAFWLAMRAAGIDRSVFLAAAVLTLVHLGTAVPTTPGNAGTFQVFVILGLTRFGVDKGAAAAFSIAGFVILTAPLWLLGGLAMGVAASRLPVGARLRTQGGV
jgi:glycosyltransferase 2 family protein